MEDEQSTLISHLYQHLVRYTELTAGMQFVWITRRVAHMRMNLIR